MLVAVVCHIHLSAEVGCSLKPQLCTATLSSLRRSLRWFYSNETENFHFTTEKKNLRMGLLEELARSGRLTLEPGTRYLWF